MCGKEFEARGSTKCCSKECSKINKHNKNREYYINNHERLLERNKQYYQYNRDNLSEYHKQYYQDNCEMIHERNKQYYQDNRDELLEKQKQYRQDNPERVHEIQKQYRQNNCEKVQEKNKQYYQDNREKLLERNKQYYQNNRDELLEKNCVRHQNIISEFCEQYDGDLEQILEYIPSQWQIREAQMRIWFDKSYFDGMIAKIKANPVCEITGRKDNLVIHHLDSFNTHPEKCADLDNLVRIATEIHDDFHNEYGYGNNTREQWFEFLEKNRNIYI